MPELTIIDSPSFKADTARHGTNSEVVVVLHFAKRLVLIGGTSYAGDIKKSVFSTLNYLLPLRGVLSMHCSANIGTDGDTALFFGLSGTGKTTLSSDPNRGLIGDDEHGWSEHGVFNFEGAAMRRPFVCQQKRNRRIYATTRRFGTVLENVTIDPVTRQLDFDSDQFTENTRAAYPIDFISNAVPSGQGGDPRTSSCSTADAFGVLPPIARLSPAAGDVPLSLGLYRENGRHREGSHRTEGHLQHLLRRTVPAAGAEPLCRTARREDCAARGAGLAREHRMDRWSLRCRHAHADRFTRAMITAALSGQLDGVHYDTHPVFNLQVPQSCHDVPSEVLNPRRHGRIRPPTTPRPRNSRRDVPRQLQDLRGVGGGRRRGSGSAHMNDGSRHRPGYLHAQLQTATKIFCGCSTAFGAPPNAHVCPVVLGFRVCCPCSIGQPSIRPSGRPWRSGAGSTRRRCSPAITTSIAISPRAIRFRSTERPLASAGLVEFDGPDGARRVQITRVHMEEDAGKSVHEGFADSNRKTNLDYNRAGTPLWRS
ncbi:MAG: phosphoenolpyruvate carboxykinase (ATP) [Vicinamibacterales bacterium]